MGKAKKDVEATEEQPKQEVWHVLDTEKTANLLNTDLTGGLTDSEAAERLEKYGPNELTEARKRTIWERIWAQVNNVLVAILVFVAIVSAIKGSTSIAGLDGYNRTDAADNQKYEDKREDAITAFIEVALIIGVIVLNTYIGIRQEGSAEKSAEALKAMLSSDAKVIRSGQLKEIPAREVVIGDLVVLGLGDRIPADLRMTKCSNLACQEAALTGESVPVEKHQKEIEAENPQSVPLGDRKNMAFSATLVAQGEGHGICVATGDHTEIGEINNMVGNVEKKKTNVLVQIDIVSKFIALFVMIVAIATFLVAYFNEKSKNDDLPESERDDTGTQVLNAISIALVTSVAMIPEGLAAIVTLTYAYAVSTMATHNAIVRVLPAVETLGSVTVICSDKTGTLTKNEMTLVGFVTSNGRYKFDTDAVERKPENFIREDSFMAHERKKKGDNKAEEEVEAKPEEVQPVVDDFPYKQGESPSMEFLRSGLAGGVLCSKAALGEDGGRDGEVGNPTEIAIIRAAYFANVDLEHLKHQQPIVAEIPFSSEYKFMATIHQPNPEVDGEGADGMTMHVKGAPDRMIPLCKYQAKGGVVASDHLEPCNEDYWQKQAANLSSHGLRVLALCRTSIPSDAAQPGENLGPEFVNGRDEPFLTMVGLCAIMDPPRPECVDAIKEAKGAGVRVAMITGDHKDTALAIGDMLGIVDLKHPEAVTGPEMDAMSDEELRAAVMTHNVFARASPENKIRIVKALQAEGQVSSMTGDGVNDAPALKAADMGVAMGKEGTDVAREAAEMILADDNFATIVTAVREGRVVWDNLRKVLLFNTPVNNAQGLTVLFGLISGLTEFPLTAIQVLYCNLICAVALGFVLAVEPAEEGIMKNPPRRVGKRLIGRYLLFRIALATVILTTCTVGAIWWAKVYLDDEDLSYDDRLALQRAQASNTLTFGAMAICLSARFSYNSGIHPRLFRGNKWAWVAVFVTAILQVCITYIPGLNSAVFQMGPMKGYQWGIVFCMQAIVFLTMEFEKSILRRMKSQGFDTDDEDPNNAVFQVADDADPDAPLVPSDSVRSATLHSNTIHR